MRESQGRIRHGLAIALLVCLAAPAPAWALPAKIHVRLVGDIDTVLSAVESDLTRSAGIAPHEIKGVTLRLKNYLEDVVVLAGKTAEVHPPTIVALVKTEIVKGTDKRIIALKLVDLVRQGKL